ncbi:ArlL2, unspecified Arf-like protein 2 [Monocercomonoides exilis]|uniref:ArlL2, unspecified Arf-like protein 2 n=1 Tax=Monocercomonoides exilis TaxID=2049356 RepID=UPI00355A1E9C|nr:ArlL2, unspecified Arf-like protein 2 [Monocercomonoides exilis]|eukprot:MONOS_11978.1-p1 / transcript=MONOS_11978.1 / gene=MONOS_11978 / organism=Monocercomonoides_exilis_PA203 / gene_product=ArlL2, unspecified Arf-like protein 2 / transcript_product=ArlL2, unspecified Arf-like protein 2 / location=Mono_scaffold00632:33899-34757(-) / protein_length=201 / sequence_SO=supercontig / SO=protein_coding / is_pseudo=false
MGCTTSSDVDLKRYILFCGLDNAGKTTILNRIQNHIAHVSTDSTPGQSNDPTARDFGEAAAEEMESVPTIGIETATITLGETTVNVLDFSGRKQFRIHWKTFEEQTDLIVFVVDLSDPGRLEEAKETLHEHILSNPKLNHCPLLIVGNKNDIEGAAQLPELVSSLFGEAMKGRAYHILSTSAKTGEGLRELIEWFLKKQV